MAILAEVIGKNYWTRRNGAAQRLPIGEKVVVKGIPDALKGKLKALKEVDDAQLIVNDSPTVARLREEGADAVADKIKANPKMGVEEAKKSVAAKKAAEKPADEKPKRGPGRPAKAEDK